MPKANKALSSVYHSKPQVPNHKAPTPGFSQWAIEEMQRFADSLKVKELTQVPAKAQAKVKRR
jgi:hypothetical protein